MLSSISLRCASRDFHRDICSYGLRSSSHTRFPFHSLRPFLSQNMSFIFHVVSAVYCVVVLYPVVFETLPLFCVLIRALYLYLKSPYSIPLSIQFSDFWHQFTCSVPFPYRHQYQPFKSVGQVQILNVISLASSHCTARL